MTKTGHTCQHSDEDIFHMIKDGRFPRRRSAPSRSCQPSRMSSTIATSSPPRSLSRPAGQPLLPPLRSNAQSRARGDAAQWAHQTEWRFPPASCSAARRQRAAATGAITATAAEATKKVATVNRA